MTTICLAQVAGTGTDPAENLRRAGDLATYAARAGASLVCFPEQFLTGWSPDVAPEDGEGLDGPTVAALRRIARENEIAVLGSFVERCDPKPCNTCIAIGDTGDILARYAKIHLFSPGGEDRHYTPGERLALFAAGGMTFGIAVCYDLRFPEIFGAYAAGGADCVLVPAAWPCRRMRHWELLIAARALENQFYVAGINAGGAPEGTYCGTSILADPDGAVVARGGAGEEAVCAVMDPALIRRARDRIPVLKDRRSDLYHRLLPI